MNKQLFILFLCLICIVNVLRLQAQNQSDFYKIVTVQNQTFVGELISEDDESITLRTESLSRVTIERANIESIEKISADRIRNGGYWFENPQSTRYFFSPNAIGLRKGRGYYQNTWVLFNNVNYGISDNLSIGGGLVPLFLFGTGETPVWFLPKVSVPVVAEKFHLGGGAMIGGIVGADTEALGILYGVGTFGNRDRNLSVSLGYGYVGSDISNTPVVNISGLIRTGREFYLLTENYFVPGVDESGIISAGFRWAPESFALDIGLFRPLIDAGDLIGIPWLGVTIPFGSK